MTTALPIGYVSILEAADILQLASARGRAGLADRNQAPSGAHR
jgi:hypothetical protein